MIWTTTPQPPTDEQVPQEPFPAAGRIEMTRARRGEAVALIGLVDSGKTSLLFALRHAPERPDRLRWLWPSSSLELARMTVQPGDLLPATPPGDFKTSRLHTLHRKWRRPPSRPSHWFPPFLRPGRRLVVPEVSGEHVRDFARGASADGLASGSQQVFEHFGDFLTSCDEVLFLAGLRGSYHEGSFRQDTVEASMSEAAACLDTIIGHIRASRSGGIHAPIFVTFLVTKRDAVGDVPGLDSVRLPASGSALVRAAASMPDGIDAKKVFQVDAEGYVSFSLNRASDEVGSDLDLQEAIAVDFLACHAPKAAAVLGGIAQRPGVSLRVLTGKPFGYECRTADNKSAAPAPGRLHSSMVWESLDDLIERSFRWRIRQRVRTAGVVAALLLVAATLLGPAAAWTCRAKADAAIRDQDIARARSWMFWDDANPWSILERRTSQAHQRDDALRWRRLRDAAPPGDSGTPEELDLQVHGRDPVGDLAGDRILRRALDRLKRYLENDPALAEVGGDSERAKLRQALAEGAHLRIHRSEAAELAEVAIGLRGQGPFPSIDGGNDWRTVATRLREVSGMIGAGGKRGAEAIVIVGLSGDERADKAEVDALKWELNRSASAADLRARLEGVLTPGDGRFDWAGAEQAALEAARADDRAMLKRIDAAVRDAVGKEWGQQIGANEPGGPVIPEIAARLGDGVLPWSFAESLRREQAARTLHDSLAEFADTLATSGDLSADVLKDARVRIDAAANALGGTVAGTAASLQALDGLLGVAEDQLGTVERLRRQDRLRGALLQRIESSFGTAPPSAVVIEFCGGQGSVQVDLGPLRGRLAQELCSGLQARLSTSADALLSSEAAIGEIDDVTRAMETVRARGHPCAKPAWLEPLVEACSAARRGSSGASAADVRRWVSVFASDQFLSPRLPRLLKLFGESDGPTDRLQVALRALLESQALGSGDRKRAAEALVQGIPAERWAPAVGWRGQADVLDAARKCGFDSAALAKAEATKSLKALLQDPGSEDRLKAVVGWQRVRSSLEPDRDFGIDYVDAYQMLADEAVRRSQREPKGPVEEMLRKFSRAFDASEPAAKSVRQLSGLLEDLARHRELVLGPRLALVPIRGADGRIDFYLSRFELCRQDLGLASLPSDERPTVINLRRDNALELARNRLGSPLRLPTFREWTSVRSRGPDLGSVKKSLGESADGLCDREALERHGDVIAIAGEKPIIGMLFGVREWCSDRDEPVGKSFKDVMSTGQKDADVGIRVALDALPASLQTYLSVTDARR